MLVKKVFRDHKHNKRFFSARCRSLVGQNVRSFVSHKDRSFYGQMLDHLQVTG